MDGILSLPTEVLGLICDELPYSTYPSVQSTCRQLRSIVLPKIWANLELEFPSTGNAMENRPSHHLERYLKRFYTSDLQLFQDPRLYEGKKVEGWIRIKEFELVRLRNSPQKYQNMVLKYVKRLKILTGNFQKIEKSKEFNYLVNHIIPVLRDNTAFKSLDLGGKLLYHQDPTDAIWDKVVNPFAEREINIEILSGVLELENAPWLSRPTMNIKTIKCQIRKCYGMLFTKFGPQQPEMKLPETLESLELTSVSHNNSEIIESQFLRDVLKPCKNLNRLLLKGYFTVSGDSLWLPETVKDLDIAFHGSIIMQNDIVPIKAPNVIKLTTCRQLMPAIGNYEFPNLEYLQLWDIINPMSETVPEEMSQIRAFHVKKLLKLNIKHLDLGEAFHNQQVYEFDEPHYYSMLAAYQKNLVSLVSRDIPYNSMNEGQMPNLQYFVLDAARQRVYWKRLIDFLKLSQSENLHGVYVLSMDAKEYDYMPKFFARFVTKYYPHKQPKVPQNVMTDILKHHRIMENCTLFEIDVAGTRSCEYII